MGNSVGTRLDKVCGSIYGLAIGDAIGFPVEFLDLGQIRQKYGLHGIEGFEPHNGFRPGTYSDDTQMSLCVARNLAKYARSDADTLMTGMAREFLEWSKSPENNRAPGNTCMAGCRNLEKGTKWSKSGVSDRPGCGSAMRVAPVGLVYHGDESKLIEVAKDSSIITHSHPTAIAAAIGAALLTSYAYRNEDPNSMVPKVYDKTKLISREFAQKIRQVEKVLHMDPNSAFELIGEGWHGDEAVAGAVYAFLRSPKDYRQTVLTAANTSGDSDSFACIAGAISGAYNGISAVPEKWVKEVENSEYLGEISGDLARA